MPDLVRVGRGERHGRAEQHLGEDPAEADEQHRPEAGIAPTPDDQLRGGRARDEDLLLGLTGAPLLTGVRGRQPVAVWAAADAAAALSRVAAAHAELAELEVNPLLVTPTEAIGLDARIVYSQPM